VCGAFAISRPHSGQCVATSRARSTSLIILIDMVVVIYNRLTTVSAVCKGYPRLTREVHLDETFARDLVRNLRDVLMREGALKVFLKRVLQPETVMSGSLARASRIMRRISSSTGGSTRMDRL
jgi:hypothetical protein